MRKTFLAIILALFCTEVSGDLDLAEAFRDGAQQAYQSKENDKDRRLYMWLGIGGLIVAGYIGYQMSVKNRLLITLRCRSLDCRNFYNLWIL